MCPWSCWSLPVTLLALFWGPGSAEEAFEIRMWPERLALEAGGSVVINCSTSCVQPEGGGLETTLAKELLDQQPQWVRYLLFNASEDTDVLCYFTCDGKQLSKSATVRVFYPPKQVLLTLPPARVAVGRSFTIECRVPAVAPLKSLTLTLFHDKETLHSQNFGEETTDPQESVVTRNFTAPEQAGSHNFSCQAELDLQSLGGGLPRSVWASKELEVYDPLKQVLLTLQPTRVAVGSSFTAECRVQAVAPLESLTLTLFHGEKPLHNQTFGEESTDPQEAVVTHNCTAPEQAGSHTFSCLVELDLLSPGWGLPHSVWASQELEVYALSQFPAWTPTSCLAVSGDRQESASSLASAFLRKGEFGLTPRSCLELRSPGLWVPRRCLAAENLADAWSSLPVRRLGLGYAPSGAEPPQGNQLVVIIVVCLCVTSVLLCFVLCQQWHQSRTGNYQVETPRGTCGGPTGPVLCKRSTQGTGPQRGSRGCGPALAEGWRQAAEDSEDSHFLAQIQTPGLSPVTQCPPEATLTGQEGDLLGLDFSPSPPPRAQALGYPDAEQLGKQTRLCGAQSA